MDPTLHDPELDDGRRPIVAVPHPPPGVGAIVAACLVILVLAVLLWYSTGSMILAASQVIAGLLMLSTFFRAGTIPPMPPALAVFEDGIKLPSDRLAPDRASWERWSYGFYSWDEVRRCQWSSFHPGQLCIYLKAAKYRSDILGPADGSGLEDPPRIFFFDVPEPHRDAVEAAIRKWGRWDD